MPDDAQDEPAAQIAQSIDYIRERYGGPEDTEVTCAGGIHLPTLGVSDSHQE